MINQKEYDFSGTMLQILGIFRLVLAVVLSALYLISQRLWPLDENLSKTFQLLLLGYLAFLLLSTIILKRRPFQNESTIRIFTIIDLVFLSILCFLTDGLDSPLIIMILISLMAHGAFLPIYQGLIFVAVALGVQAYFWLSFNDPKDFLSIHSYLSDPYIIKIVSQGLFTAFAVVLSNRWLRTIRIANIEVRQKDRQLENIALLHEAVIQQLNNGIIVIDQEANIVLVNQFIQDWFSTKITPGISLNELFPDIFKRYTLWNSLNFLDRKPIHHANNQFYIDFIRISSPTLQYTLIDIEQADVVNQRAQQNKLAALGQLTAAIAHEIRNPMTSIFQASQLLKEQSDLTDLEIRLIEMVNKNINRANKIINKVLSLAKRDTPHLEIIPIKEWLEEKIADFKITYPEYALCVKLKLDPQFKTVYFDRNHLEQILINLLTNIIRHSYREPHELSIHIIGEINDNNPSLAIMDNGIPIKKEKQPHLFEPFYTTDKKGGTGLGLFIVQEICENNHAYIDYIEQPMLHGFRIIFSKHN